MFKVWQVFVFSAVPLALVFLGVIIGSMPGVDSEKEDIPTPPPAASPSAAGASGSAAIDLVATALRFDKSSLTARANTAVTVRLDNKDASVQHNFALYTDRTAATRIFSGDRIAGPAVATYNFTAPAAGTYYFRCDVHLDAMSGTFIVS